eukprot:3101367-Prymnesium_polylepis.1
MRTNSFLPVRMRTNSFHTRRTGPRKRRGEGCTHTRGGRRGHFWRGWAGAQHAHEQPGGIAAACSCGMQPHACQGVARLSQVTWVSPKVTLVFPRSRPGHVGLSQ